MGCCPRPLGFCFKSSFFIFIPQNLLGICFFFFFFSVGTLSQVNSYFKLELENTAPGRGTCDLRSHERVANSGDGSAALHLKRSPRDVLPLWLSSSLDYNFCLETGIFY